MATIQTGTGDRMYQIKKWLGINEAEEGDAALKMGEAAVMRNFRVTAGGALKKRPGSKTVAGLTSGYRVVIDGEDQLLVTEEGKSDYAIELYPRVTTDSVGSVIFDGEAVECEGYGDAQNYEEYFCEMGGRKYRFKECVPKLPETYYVIPSGTGGWGISNWRFYSLDAPSAFPNFYIFESFPAYKDGEWDLTGGRLVSAANAASSSSDDYIVGKYVIPRPLSDGYAAPREANFNGSGIVLHVTGLEYHGTKDYAYMIGTLYYQPKWEWYFNGAGAETVDVADAAVRALWSGFVAGEEVICAACNSSLWQLSVDSGGSWSKISCGAIDTSGTVFLFGFDEKLYIMTETEYKCWDGQTITTPEGYRPIVTMETQPEGGGTEAEPVNMLNGLRRAWYSPDGTATEFKLTEAGIESVDWVKDLITGEIIEATEYTVDLDAGSVTFDSPPDRGIDTIEIAWTYPEDSSDKVIGMKYAELYNGAQDTRVFIYGDGSNKCYYSGLDYDGNARADYFPDLNECAVGDSNTPITAMIRHYGRLICYKLDSTWSLYYDTLSLADGSVMPAFYIVPVNREIGSCAYGEARLVENRPRTLDGRSVIEWKATSTSGNITSDQRNAQRISQRVASAIRSFDLSAAKTFYDKVNHDYYVLDGNGTALVNNVDADAWYIYTNFNALCMMSYKDELYYGTADGWLKHLSDGYLSDDGEAIDAYWESGAMDFAQDFKRKYSSMIWVGIKPENNARLSVSAKTDMKSDFAEYPSEAPEEGAVPEVRRIKLRARKFTYYKLIFANDTAGSTATVIGADIRVHGAGYVR